MRIVSWNVNSIGVRLPRVLDYLDREQPEVLCLQEIKTVTEKFPSEAFLDKGYYCSVLGQKTYNGVAILSKEKPQMVQTGMGLTQDYDLQSRVLRADFQSLSIVNVYVPNGQSVTSEKYQYKLEWLRYFREYIEKLSDRRVVIVGDFNIAPRDIDVHDPALWSGSILCSEKERQALNSLFDLGFYDSFRLFSEDGGHYSWWDYRQLAFPQNKGLRIDLCLISENLRTESTGAGIDRNERKGEKPSDHAPVWVDIACE